LISSAFFENARLSRSRSGNLAEERSAYSICKPHAEELSLMGIASIPKRTLAALLSASIVTLASRKDRGLQFDKLLSIVRLSHRKCSFRFDLRPI
jgi:hypothetical protein